MSAPASRAFDHYERLRGDLDALGRACPTLAARFRADAPLDPHVERIVQATAACAGRIEDKIADDLPDVVQGLLGVLNETLLAPLPSMGVVEFALPSGVSVATAGQRLPSAQRVVVSQPEFEDAQFSITEPTTIWPLRVAELRTAPPGPEEVAGTAQVLRVLLEATHPCDLSRLELASLRFFVHGDREATTLLDRMLAGVISHRVVLENGRETIDLGAGNFRSIGWSRSESLLPSDNRTPDAPRLLAEYLAFPQRFAFVESGGWGRLRTCSAGPVTSLELRLGLRQRLDCKLEPKHMRLNCVPVVNLFEVTSEILVDPRLEALPVRATTDTGEPCLVHSISGVEAVDPTASQGKATRRFHRFYEEPTMNSSAPGWYRPRWERSLDGRRELLLQLVERDLAPLGTPPTSLCLRLLCMNRSELFDPLRWRPKAVRVPMAPALQAAFLERPTRGQPPQFDQDAAWRLIALLSTSTSSLVAGPEALRELVGLLGREGSESPNLGGSIRDVRARDCVRRIQTPRGAGFARGLQVDVLVEPSLLGDTSLVATARLLSRFFVQMCAANGFVELRLCDDNGKVLHECLPHAGERVLL